MARKLVAVNAARVGDLEAAVGWFYYPSSNPSEFMDRAGTRIEMASRGLQERISVASYDSERLDDFRRSIGRRADDSEGDEPGDRHQPDPVLLYPRLIRSDGTI